MSQVTGLDLIPEELWDLYQVWCKEEGVTPDLSDFMVWVNDQDIDFEPENWDV